MYLRGKKAGLFLFFVVILVSGLGGCEMAQSKEQADLADNVLDKQGRPTETLQKLLDLFGIEHDGTLESVVAETQKVWLRPAGKERWEVALLHEGNREQILPLLKKIGSVDAIFPSQKNYQYGVVLGALVSRVRSRFAFLLDLWKKGIRFDEVVFLGGERPLHATLESADLLLDPNNKELPFSEGWRLKEKLPETETEMMKMVFDQAELPEGFAENVNVTFVDAQMQQRADGTLRRPTTNDTVEKWLEQNPEPGSCLFVSNQPYTGRQDSVARTYLPKRFSIETVGSQAYQDLPIVTFLDSLARWLYQEKKRRG